MCASSTMYTLYRLDIGPKDARSRSSRASSTPPWLAAAISLTSRLPRPPRPSLRPPRHAPEGRPLAQLPGIVDPAVARRVDLDDVEAPRTVTGQVAAALALA